MVKHRKLSRSSAHRQALLRNLIDALFQHEKITTTFARAKETQRIAEKLITLGKRNTDVARRSAQSIFVVRFYFQVSLQPSPEWALITLILQQPHLYMPKLFGELRTRYAARPGGYTRVLRIEPRKEDQAPTAILEFVDSPNDTRLTLTAQTLAHRLREALPMNELTALNVKKATQFRAGGVDELRELTRRFAKLGPSEDTPLAKRKVYPEPYTLEAFNRIQDRAKRNRELAKKAPWWHGLRALFGEDENSYRKRRAGIF
jgi:large subunit ribosomal protein L17